MIKIVHDSGLCYLVILSICWFTTIQDFVAWLSYQSADSPRFRTLLPGYPINLLIHHDSGLCYLVILSICWFTTIQDFVTWLSYQSADSPRFRTLLPGYPINLLIHHDSGLCYLVILSICWFTTIQDFVTWLSYQSADSPRFRTLLPGYPINLLIHHDSGFCYLGYPINLLIHHDSGLCYLVMNINLLIHHDFEDFVTWLSYQSSWFTCHDSNIRMLLWWFVDCSAFELSQRWPPAKHEHIWLLVHLQYGSCCISRMKHLNLWYSCVNKSMYLVLLYFCNNFVRVTTIQKPFRLVGHGFVLIIATGQCFVNIKSWLVRCQTGHWSTKRLIWYVFWSLLSLYVCYAQILK